jgi:transcriptional regulator with XRE-family HTH domain
VKKRRRKYYADEAFLKNIGENIRRIRLEKGMTQMELAFACNEIDYSQINRMERGKVNFSVSYLSLIARALEISPADLLAMISS